MSQKHQQTFGIILAYSKTPSEDSENTKIGLLDQILASVKCTYPCKWGLKYQIFAYFSTFFHFLWPMDLYTCGIESGHHNTILGAQPVPFWSQGTDFIPENGHNLLWKLAEKSDFCTFFNFLPFFSPILVFFESSEGFWNMPRCFQMFVDVFETSKGVKNEIKQKTSFFSPIPLLKSTIS